MSAAIRVLVVDDHVVVSRGIRSLLDQYDDLEVVGVAASSDEALATVAADQPDVALIDIMLAGPGAPTGIDLARQLKRGGDRPRIAIVTAFDDPQIVFDAFRAGVDAYILKTVAEDVLADAIRAVHAGDRFVSGPILGSVLNQFEDLARRRVQDDSGLSDEDIQVLRLLADGATTAQISAALFVSEPTSKRRMRSIFDRMGVPNRTQAVVEAMRRGLI
jgi:DNA-binding NarL/FixJ family response regulator